MTLVTFQIPDEPRQLADWLERQLVGRELRGLVVELNAILGETAQHESLNSICGGQLPEVLDRGLTTLRPETLRRLLKSPQSLFTLQERAFIEGGDYWETVPRSTEHQQAAESAFARIQATVANSVRDTKKSPSPSRRFGMVFGLLSMSIVAASVFLGVMLWNQPAAGPTWGFDRPGALTADIPPKDYLESLATAASDWFKKRPETPVALEKRLAEFRHGCDTLLAAPHPQLAAKDRDWLKERCQVWSKKLDGHIADLKADTKPLDKIQTEADATINALVTALRSRVV